jgi:hypothetical protein
MNRNVPPSTPHRTYAHADARTHRNRMFSGFKSQWMMSTSGRARNSNAFSRCRENLRMRLSDTPRNLCDNGRGSEVRSVD